MSMHSRLMRPFHFFRHRPRLVVGLAVALLAGAVLQCFPISSATAWIIAWNLGSIVFQVLALLLMLRTSTDTISERAQAEDEGMGVMLLMVCAATAASILAIVFELGVAQKLSGSLKTGHLLLTVATILLSWFFVQVMFTLHYAHHYYRAQHKGQNPGLDFPGGDDTPDYLDFLYFSAIIGTSGQTADVSVTSSAMRRTNIVHCILAFFFNATILASMINIAAGLLSGGN